MPDKQSGSKSKKSSSGGDKEKQPRKSDPDGGGKAKKEDKPYKELKDKSRKEGAGSKDGSKPSKDGSGKAGKASSSSDRQAPKERAMKAPAKPAKDLDPWGLPPSESEEEEEEEEIEREEKPTELPIKSNKDSKKLAEKERKLAEKAYQQKQAALRDDDNVFDVAFEGQGQEGDGVVSATDVKVQNLTVRAKGKLLLDSTSLTIAAGNRYGLVGPNGKGKSTLMRLMARRQIPVPNTIDVLLVEQEVQADERSALQAVVEADLHLMELRRQEEVLTAMLSRSTEDQEAPNPAANGAEADDDGKGTKGGGEPKAPEVADDDELAGLTMEEAQQKLNEVYEELRNIGGSSAEARASKILAGLGFSKVMQGRTTKSFSGGWRMRISLARALYLSPTLLLLDEPTNHLDLRAVLWLEEYLMRWKKTLVVVSHDRDFLNTVTTHIIHLHDLQLDTYTGNFEQFEGMYEQKRKQVNAAYEKYEKQMKAAKQSGEKKNQAKVQKEQMARQKGKGGGKAKGKDAFGGEASESKATAPKRWSDYTVAFDFPEPTELPSPLIQMIDVEFKYPGREDFGLSDVNIGVHMDSRVAIVGPNGAGKSTLMNLLAGDLEPTEGEVRKSPKLRIGRYAQHFVDLLSMDETPVEYLLNRFPEANMSLTDVRGKLGRFGLEGSHHLQPICKLSGGQKSRVVFAAISLQQPHILLFDEPTNHLDMQSIDALSEAIAEFEGGVIVISHDSQLLQTICDDEERSEVWIVDDGKITEYSSDFDDYKQELIKEIARDMDED